jgi:ABC-type dipeptide/oligopeptide/nickel transport systems, permease components
MTRNFEIWRFIFRRLLGTLPLLIGVGVFTFILVRVLPGDPAAYYATGPMATNEEIAQVRTVLGLDRPIAEQLGRYFRDIASGDLGRSLVTGQLVSRDLVERFPASFELTLVAMILALLISIPLGIVAAIRAGSWIDHIVRFIGTLGVSMPAFVAGILLIFIFYFKLGIAPEPIDRIDPFMLKPPSVTGLMLFDSVIAGNFSAFSSAVGRLLLPALTMAIIVIAPLMRMTRASMIAVLGSDFIRTARAAGMNWWTVYVLYGLRNALLPVLTTIGLVISYQLGANVVVEKVFAWPGVGSYALNSLLATDYAPVQGYVLLMACVYVVINTSIDILYALVDPRIRVQ